MVLITVDITTIIDTAGMHVVLCFSSQSNNNRIDYITTYDSLRISRKWNAD